MNMYCIGRGQPTSTSGIEAYFSKYTSIQREFCQNATQLYALHVTYIKYSYEWQVDIILSSGH